MSGEVLLLLMAGWMLFTAGLAVGLRLEEANLKARERRLANARRLYNQRVAQRRAPLDEDWDSTL